MDPPHYNPLIILISAVPVASLVATLFYTMTACRTNKNNNSSRRPEPESSVMKSVNAGSGEANTVSRSKDVNNNRAEGKSKKEKEEKESRRELRAMDSLKVFKPRHRKSAKEKQSNDSSNDSDIIVIPLEKAETAQPAPSRMAPPEKRKKDKGTSEDESKQRVSFALDGEKKKERKISEDITEDDDAGKDENNNSSPKRSIMGNVNLK